MGQNARQHFIEQFSMERNIGKLADWFEGIVAMEKKQ